MNQIILTWTKILENNLSMILILEIVNSNNSPTAVEFVHDKITSDIIKDWYEHYHSSNSDLPISKLFVDTTIKKYPQLYDTVLYQMIRFYYNNIILYFPGITLQEVIVVIEKYHASMM